ncbi:prephenate dehydrogenase [Aerococcaceae bacterium WGS1372]
MLNVAIIGLGVIGGTFAKAFKASDSSNYNVMGIDTNPEAITKAIEAGVITEGEVENQTILQRADIVIIALYPDNVATFIEEHADEFKEDAIVTETTGVKQSIIDKIIPVLPAQIEFIFGHPMAGRESRGFDYSDHTAFIGANYVLTPLETNSKESLDSFQALLRRIGFNRITQVSPKVHDELIAYTSQLCHVIATALINSDQDEHNTSQFIGDSFRDLTRIAKLNENLWSELMLSNKEALLTIIEQFESKIDQLKQAIVNDDKESLESQFIEATERRVKLEENDLKI